MDYSGGSQVSCGYDAASRLTKVVTGSCLAGYKFVPLSSLVSDDTVAGELNDAADRGAEYLIPTALDS